jgi:MoaA/NifB/PqqE/SkfB family radical SAM enzyme
LSEKIGCILRRKIMESVDVRQARIDLRQQPFMVFWEVTRACDLVCRHCRAEAQPMRHPAELSLPEVLRVLDDLAPARPLLVLTGGDCFKRADLEDIARAAVERRIPVAISPSPTPLVTRERLVRLYEVGVRAASLSLDGASPETYDTFRGVPGTFETALRIWGWFREIGYKVQINTTVTRLNVRELPAIARMVLERGAMTWSVFFLVRTGRGRALAAALFVTVGSLLGGQARPSRVTVPAPISVGEGTG